MSSLDKKQARRGATWRSVAVIAAATVAVSIYLFATAPPPLAAPPVEARTVSLDAVFSILQSENAAARAVWTEEIVKHGKAVGLAFDEAWRDDRVHAGPLPALFLRETARNLERSALRLRLFLGSRFPINAANQFTGEQAARFATLEQTGAPQFFFEPGTKLHTAMFADRAVVAACVECHNAHAESPKTDWKLHAIMGATTWMYPDGAVTAERAIQMVGALRTSIRAAYAAYLKKVATFPTRPELGTRWPRDGFYLPTEDAFMAELARRSSPTTLLGLLDPSAAPMLTALPPAPPPTPAPTGPPPAAKSTFPTLVIRSVTPTRVIIDHVGGRLLVATLPAGGATSLSAAPPLRLRISDPAGVQIDYDGKPVAVPDVSSTPETEGLVITLGAWLPEKS